MKNKTNILGISLVLLLVAVAVIAVIVFGGETPAEFTPAITDSEGNEIPGSIAAIETIKLGGVAQTITIRGADTTKPVLLFLHGGPGMPSSPWATWNDFHSDLEQNFVLVHWDQRGAGKSFSGALIPDDMHLENFVSDTLELTDILRERFNQDKIFLYGHSWGSGLGFETLKVNTEPYYAFIASGVRPEWNSSNEMGYEKVLEMAHQANDAEAIESLELIQPFDPMNPEHLQVKNQFLPRYLIGEMHTEGLEEAYLDYVIRGNSPEYPPSYIQPTLTGLDFSRQTIGLEIINSGFDLARDFPVSPIPIHFIHGRYDYATPGDPAEAYYNTLQAPDKSFTWFENSAHDVYYDEADEFNQKLIGITNEILSEVKE
jgi:pimeloyl-ACP methyl ester carboxylesterase